MSTFVAPTSAAILCNNFLSDEAVSIVVRDSNTATLFPEENLLNEQRSKYWLVSTSGTAGCVVDLGSARRPTVAVFIDTNSSLLGASNSDLWILTGADDSAMLTNVVAWYLLPTSREVVKFYLGPDYPAGVTLFFGSGFEVGFGIEVTTAT